MHVDADYTTLDKLVVDLARKVLAGRACEKDWDKHRAWNNEKVRKEMGISTIKRTVEKRKVDWLKTIVCNRDDNVMLRAALTGNLALDTMGTTEITPWMTEMAEILTKLYCRTRWFLPHTKKCRHHNMDWIWDETDIFQTRTESLLETKD